MKFNDFKIGTRLGCGFAAVLLLMALMLMCAQWQLGRIAEAKLVMADTRHTAKLAQQWLEGIATNSVRTIAKVKTDSADDERYFDAEMKALHTQAKKVQQDVYARVTTEQAKALLNVVAAKLTRYTAIRNQVFAHKAQWGANNAQLQSEVAEALIPAMQDYVHAVEDFAAYEDRLFDDANAHIDDLHATASRLLMGIGAIALIAGATFGYLLTCSITRPLASAVALAGRIASGDLTADIRVSSRDEVGALLAALKTMNASLLNTVRQVLAGADVMVTASQQIASGNLDLSSRTEQQASSLEETAASMEELTGTVRQNADHAAHANTLALAASDIATSGRKVVTQVTSTMAAIEVSSRSIGDIIGVIDGIAFQTNILALNAAVEAARAGEQGRGFAVVATEVRQLAQRSASAAKEIRTLVGASMSNVEAGKGLAGQAGATMREIVLSVEQVTALMSEIAAATAEQVLGIEQVNAAVMQMDDTTQQNAALVEEAAAAATSLREQASSLSKLVSVFNVGGTDPMHQAALRRSEPAVAVAR